MHAPPMHAPPSRADLLASALAAALPGIVLGIGTNAGLAGGSLLNPDSAMRLVRLNDILAAGRPLHAVMRDASGDGNVLPWSHLLDSLLLLIAAPLSPFLGWHAALHAAALAFGPLAMAGLGVAVAWAAAPLADRAWLWLGAFALGVTPALIGYGSLGVVHHHVLLIIVPLVMSGWVIRLLQSRADQNDGPALALGVWAAAGLWLSPEALPFSLMAIGALWATFLFGRPHLARPIFLASAAMALLATLAWLTDPPSGGLAAVEPDRLSLPYVALTWGALLAAAIASRFGPRAALAASAALAAAWLTAFPQLLQGTAGLMPPDQAQAFFDGIAEMAPLSGLDDSLRLLPGGLLALLALIGFARNRPAARIQLLYAAACLAVAMALAVAHVRFVAYPAAAGAVALPAVFTAIARLRISPLLHTLTRSAILAGLIAAPLIVPSPAEAHPPAPPSCPLSGAVALLTGHPAEIVLAPVNLGPHLLYATPILIVGSLYHRNPAAYLRLEAAWREPPGDAPGPAFRDTRAHLVLACPGGPRSASLAGSLTAGDAPPWLHRLADAGPGGYVLYRAQLEAAP